MPTNAQTNITPVVEELYAEDAPEILSQWQLMYRRFRKHRLAVAGGIVLAIFYLVAIFRAFYRSV